MKETVPTVEEIIELKEMCKKMTYQELAASGILEDSRKSRYCGCGFERS